MSNNWAKRWLKRWLLWVPIVAAGIASNMAAAETSAQNVEVMVRGAGLTLCSDWESRRKSDTYFSEAQWALGYWTAFQTRAKYPARFTKSTNEEVLKLIDDMCAINKGESIGTVLNVIAVMKDS